MPATRSPRRWLPKASRSSTSSTMRASACSAMRSNWTAPNSSASSPSISARMTDLSLRFSDQLIRQSRRHPQCRLRSPGFLPGPGMAVYYASKAYVLSFTEALRAGACAARRPRHRAVSRPGAVGISGAGRVSSPDSIPRSSTSRRPMSRRQAYRGLMANKRAVLPGLGIKIVPLLLRLFPRGFILARSAASSCASADKA